MLLSWLRMRLEVPYGAGSYIRQIGIRLGAAINRAGDTKKYGFEREMHSVFLTQLKFSLSTYCRTVRTLTLYRPMTL